MKKNYAAKNLLFIPASFLILIIASCSKDSTKSTAPVTPAPRQLGLYLADSSIYKIALMAITQVGTVNISDNANFSNDLVFDTGSGGMVIDADNIIPTADYNSTSGFNVPGDSLVVDGITITSQKSVIEYGDDNASVNRVYGNLAYASVVVGDNNGSITIKRLPFFLYYKATDANGNAYNEANDSHLFDVFGVNDEYDISFNNGAYITSPFSYYTPGTGLTKGFKLAPFGGSANFSYYGTYQPVLTVGLTAADISSSSGYTTTHLSFNNSEGYNPIVPASITYNSHTVQTTVLYDSGTEPDNYIEDPTVTDTLTLANNIQVNVAATFGFNYSYTTVADNNITFVENPNTSGGEFSVMGIDFFQTNYYMLDLADNILGLKSE